MSDRSRRAFLGTCSAAMAGSLAARLAHALPVAQRSRPSLALTPPMGWMTWNQFGGNISDTLLREVAQALTDSGLREAGYRYLCIDDLWQGGRDARGRLYPHPDKFPNGIKPLADWLHARGFKLGIYSDAAETTCAGAVGSLGHEDTDARTFAEWGIDYLKYDYCGAPDDVETAKARYAAMARALRRTGRPIVFSVCEWGAREPWRWAAASGGHLWRTTWDVRDTWEGEYHAGRAGIMSIVDRQVALADYAGPGRWNDPDMLVVGLYGKGESSTITGYPPMNDTEYRTQMSLWCLMAAPLLISCDVRSMNAPTRETLGHPEIIAIDQDPLGRQGYRAIKDRTIEIWKKPLAGGEVALGFLNRGDAAAEVTLRWTDIALAPSWRVRDVWRREELGVVRDRITLAVASHETRVVRLSR